MAAPWHQLVCIHAVIAVVTLVFPARAQQDDAASRNQIAGGMAPWSSESSDIDGRRLSEGKNQLMLVLIGIIAVALCCGFILGCRLVDVYHRRTSAKSGNPAVTQEEYKPKSPEIPKSEKTLWRYKHTEKFAVRASPDLKGAKTSKSIKPDELLIVSKEYKDKHGHLFLQLADGSGWVAEQVSDVGTICVSIPISAPAQTDSALGGPVWDWEYFRDSGWIEFDQATCGLLSRAESKGLTAVELTGRSEKLVIDLVSMQQVNMVSNKRIAVRPCQKGTMTV